MTIFGQGTHPVSGYYEHNGEKYNAVTSILGCLNKPALPGWAARLAGEYAVEHWDTLSSVPKEERAKLIAGASKRYTAEAAGRGTSVHHAISDLLQTGTVHVDGALQPYLRAWADFRKDHNPDIVANELTVFNRTCRYAGTLDLLAELDGELTLIDIKTGGVWPEAALQITAYAHAEFYVEKDEEKSLPTPTRGAILQLTPQGAYDLVPTRIDDELFAAFRYVYEAHRFQNVTSKDVFLRKMTKGPF